MSLLRQRRISVHSRLQSSRIFVLFFFWHVILPRLAVAELGCFAPLPAARQPFFRQKQNIRFLPLYASEQPHKPPVIAIIGGDLAGVTAALTIAEQQQECTIKLFTSHSRVLEGMIYQSDAYPILPDVTLENRKLIERFGHGGRELAGLLAKQCSPLQAKDWLEQQGVVLQEGQESSNERNVLILLQEKSLYVSPSCDLRRVLEEKLVQAKNIHVETNVVITDVGHNDDVR